MIWSNERLCHENQQSRALNYKRFVSILSLSMKWFVVSIFDFQKSYPETFRRFVFVLCFMSDQVTLHRDHKAGGD